MSASALSTSAPFAILGVVAALLTLHFAAWTMTRTYFSRPRLILHWESRQLHGLPALCLGVENKPLYAKWITAWGVRRKSIRVEVLFLFIEQSGDGMIAESRAVVFHDVDGNHVSPMTLEPTWIPAWAMIVRCERGVAASVLDDENTSSLLPTGAYTATISLHYPDEEREMEVWARDFVVTKLVDDSYWVTAPAKRIS